ncbi:MAG: TIGR04372 family glycosyltransferase [Elusimicrobiota bacterium]
MIRVLRRGARYLVQLCGAVVILLLYAVKPVLWLRLGRLHSDRIGILAAGTDLFLRRRQLGDVDPRIRHLFVARPTCNRQLLEMYQRLLPIYESAALSKIYDICVPLLKHTPFYEPLAFRCDEFREFAEGRRSLSFTPEEEFRGRKLLAEMGIKDGDWFVCFHNRDGAYLTQEFPDRDWSYHDERDNSIENLCAAVRYVVDSGGAAVRMGAVVQHPLPASFQHPRIIDYARKHRSDFLDIYLLAKCKFMIGSDTGLAQVATVFDVPVANTNSVYSDWAAFRPDDIFITKKVYDVNAERYLGYREALCRGVSLTGLALRDYEKSGLSLHENTAAEIKDLVLEMNERLDGVWKVEPADEDLQRRYCEMFSERDFCYGFRSRVGTRFLWENKSRIFGDGEGVMPSLQQGA